MFKIRGGKELLINTALNNCMGITVFKNGSWVTSEVNVSEFAETDVAFEMSYDDARASFSQYMYKLNMKIKEFIENGEKLDGNM